MDFRAALLVAFGPFVVGCADDKADAPPVNSRIENRAGVLSPDVPILPYQVNCEGPDEEIRLLGGICGTETKYMGWTPTDAPAGMGMYIGPLEGPYLMVFGRVEHEVAPGHDASAELGYSAFFVDRGPVENSVETLDQWRDGESVTSGSLVTYHASFGACTDSWIGEGTLLWRSTTISLAWSSGLGC